MLLITKLGNYYLFLDNEIRLIGGINKLEGRVEVKYQGTWGTICDDGWDEIDATVVCRELGFLNGTTTRQDRYGSSSGPVWLSQVSCLGNESKLSHCMHSGAGIVGSCSHAQDVAVQCSAHGMNVYNYDLCAIMKRAVLWYISTYRTQENFCGGKTLANLANHELFTQFSSPIFTDTQKMYHIR